MVTFTCVILLNLLLLFFNKRIIKIYNIYDKKNFKHIGLVGGLYLLINFLIIFNLLLYFDNTQIENFIWNKRTYFSFFLSVTFIFMMGYLDDKYDLSPNTRLFLMIMIIFINLFINENLIINQIKFSNNFSFYINPNLTFFFSLLCFVTIINLSNMFDGINLQLIIFSIFIIVVCLINHNNILLINLLIVLLLIFLLNYKNIIFLGNTGSYLCGYFLGFLLVNSYKAETIFTDDILVMLFIPFIDMLRVIFYRIINKKHIFQGDLNHIHHILVNKFGYLKALLFIHFMIMTPYAIYILNKSYLLPILIILLISYIFIIKEKK